MWYQQTLTLGPKSRGFHLVTDEVLGQIRGLSGVKVGLLHLLLQHTSASLTLNENCDPTVRYDMEQYFLNAVPDNAPYEHDYEGLSYSRINGILIQRGPPRPRTNSLPEISFNLTPASFNSRLVMVLRS